MGSLTESDIPSSFKVNLKRIARPDPGGFDYGLSWMLTGKPMVKKSMEIGLPVIWVSANHRVNVSRFLSLYSGEKEESFRAVIDVIARIYKRHLVSWEVGKWDRLESEIWDSRIKDLQWNGSKLSL